MSPECGDVIVVDVVEEGNKQRSEKFEELKHCCKLVSGVVCDLLNVVYYIMYMGD